MHCIIYIKHICDDCAVAALHFSHYIFMYNYIINRQDYKHEYIGIRYIKELFDRQTFHLINFLTIVDIYTYLLILLTTHIEYIFQFQFILLYKM